MAPYLSAPQVAPHPTRCCPTETPNLPHMNHRNLSELPHRNPKFCPIDPQVVLHRDPKFCPIDRQSGPHRIPNSAPQKPNSAPFDPSPAHFAKPRPFIKAPPPFGSFRLNAEPWRTRGRRSFSPSLWSVAPLCPRVSSFRSASLRCPFCDSAPSGVTLPRASLCSGVLQRRAER